MFISIVEEERKVRFLYGKDAVSMGGNQGEDKREKKSSKGSVVYEITLEVA